MAFGVLGARGRAAAAVLAILVLGSGVLPAAAQSDPGAAVQNAQQNLQNARQQAQQADSALGEAQQNLAAAQAKLSDLDHQIAAIDHAIADDDAKVADLNKQEQMDRAQLGDMLRVSYMHGLDSPLLYVISAANLSSALQRQGDLAHVADKSQQLMHQIASARTEVQKALSDATTRRAQLDVAKQQAQATAVLVSIEEQKVAIADTAAWNTVNASQAQLADALNAKKLWDAEQERQRQLALQRQQHNVFPPVPGVQFTIDTDLTQPSGETAARLNSFLQGTALAGLGDAFMAAESQYHVSARYFLAHAIEESAFGTSRIAQDKHNLFGYGADDAHPYQDAYTFPSFAACIDTVARHVANDYLSPSGAFYHGPTLRGMNVTYASDPSWAQNIAAIARSIP